MHGVRAFHRLVESSAGAAVRNVEPWCLAGESQEPDSLEYVEAFGRDVKHNGDDLSRPSLGDGELVAVHHLDEVEDALNYISVRRSRICTGRRGRRRPRTPRGRRRTCAGRFWCSPCVSACCRPWRTPLPVYHLNDACVMQSGTSFSCCSSIVLLCLQLGMPWPTIPQPARPAQRTVSQSRSCGRARDDARRYLRASEVERGSASHQPYMHAFNCIGGEATRTHAGLQGGRLVHPCPNFTHPRLALVSVSISSQGKVKANRGVVLHVCTDCTAIDLLSKSWSYIPAKGWKNNRQNPL